VTEADSELPTVTLQQIVGAVIVVGAAGIL
jgi:hypothetical protein